MSDERVEAAEKRIRSVLLGLDGDDDALRVSAAALQAADEADREQGIHRVKVDDAAVERVAKAMTGVSDESWKRVSKTTRNFYRREARAAITALTGADL